MPVGNALAGPLADQLGVKPVLVGCAVLLLVAGAAPLAWRSTRDLRTATATTTDPAPAGV
jgi:MFS family permease